MADQSRNDEHDETILSSKETPSSTKDMPAEIGGYRIFGLLGAGGMGVVYEAEQRSPRRRVALKVVRGTEQVDELRLRMFEREAATLARLHHPNIGAIYESGRTQEGRHFFGMELVRGSTLAEWLASRFATPDRRARAVADRGDRHERVVRAFGTQSVARPRGETVTAREVMDEGARQNGDELNGEPIMHARLMSTIGQVYGSLGLYDDARRLAQQAPALCSQNLPADHIDIAASQHQLANMLEEVGDREGARAAVGDFEGSREASGRAMALARTRKPLDEDRILKLLNHESGVLTNTGQLDLAEENNFKALAIYKPVYGESHPMDAKAYGNAGMYLAQQGKLAEARPCFESALTGLIDIHGPKNPDIGQGHLNLGLCKLQLGDAPAAIEDLQLAVDVLEHTSPDGMSIALSVSLYQLAIARATVSEYAMARKLMERVVAMRFAHSPLRIRLHRTTESPSSGGCRSVVRPDPG